MVTNVSVKHIIQLLFHNETSTEPKLYQLNMPGKPFNLPVDDFIDFAKPLIPIDWEAECQIRDSEGAQQASLFSSG